MLCPNCDHVNAETARFCDVCGGTLSGAAAASASASTGPTTRLDESGPDTRASEVEAATPVVPTGLPWREMNGGLWLIGLGVLFLTGTFWPGILVLVGISAYLEERARGHERYALRTLLFPLGLALLFWTHWFWPGILILLGVLAIVSPEIRPRSAGTTP